MVIALFRVTGSGNRTRLTTCFDQFIPWCCVNDTENWQTSVETAREEFRLLTNEQLVAVRSLAGGVMACKGELTALFDALNGGAVCSLCRGECCRAGRYHFTAVDLLAYLVTSAELFLPRFNNGACPFLGDSGCLMQPLYRPYNCLTFVCDRIDAGMEPCQRGTFSALSERLFGCYREMEAMFHNRFTGGLLNNGERFRNGRSKGILWG